MTSTGKDNPTLLAGHGTAVQHQSRFPTEIPPRTPATALQEHSSSPHALSCQQTGTSPSSGRFPHAHKPARTQAWIPKGMNRSVSYFPNHTKCCRDTGRMGELTPNIPCTMHRPTTPEQPCPASLPRPWFSHPLGQHEERTKENNPKPHEDPGKVLFHTRPPSHRPGLHPRSKQRKANSM